MDEAERAGIDLAERLPDAADPEYAAHWAQTLKFLHIVTGIWPAWLAENGVMNPAARQVALLDAQASAWADAPPDHPVLIAGTTAGIPAVARLLRVVAQMPMGQVVLPQLDLGMDDGAWGALELWFRSGWSRPRRSRKASPIPRLTWLERPCLDLRPKSAWSLKTRRQAWPQAAPPDAS